MKSAMKLALLALLPTASGLGCSQSDNVIGILPWHDGRTPSAAGTANSVGAGASGIANKGGVGGRAAATASGGFANGGTSALVDNRIPSNAGGASGVAAGGYLDSGGTGNALQIGNGGLSLIPSDGWVDGTSNALGIQGAFFADADSTSIESLEADFTGNRACIRGTAAIVDQQSTPCATHMFTPPATDCYGEFWGAKIGLNLNQPAVGAAPLHFDASALGGFSFDISGDLVPSPNSLRFQVDSASGEFCNLAVNKVRTGSNTMLFSNLAISCWNNSIPTAEVAKPALIALEWVVVTNSSGPVPYAFCVSNIRAIRK